MSREQFSAGAHESLAAFPTERLFCLTKQAAAIMDIIPELPLRLPKGREISLVISRQTLTISSPAGLQGAHVIGGSSSADILVTREGLEIDWRRAGITTIQVIFDPRESEGVGLVSLAQAAQPIDLLDEYAALRAKRNLTPQEEARLRALPACIGKEFREREEALRQRAERRSTPPSYGESRGGYGQRASG